MNFNQGVYERAMQIGDVEFTTAGTDESNFVFAGVAQPEQVVQQVEHATPVLSASRARPSRGPSYAGASAFVPRLAASRRVSARSVRSQVKSESSRPKWP